MTESSATLRVTGRGALEAFEREAGGHRWQRVPPTEKRGRVHSSTVTVAVMPMRQDRQVTVLDRDLRIETMRGSGAGGQHRNKTDSAVRVTHVPTGTVVRCESERSQHMNKALALEILEARIAAAVAERATAGRNRDRRQQVGSGMRADKVRTVAIQRGQVECHASGRSWPVKAYLRGDLSDLYPA